MATSHAPRDHDVDDSWSSAWATRHVDDEPALRLCPICGGDNAHPTCSIVFRPEMFQRATDLDHLTAGPVDDVYLAGPIVWFDGDDITLPLERHDLELIDAR